MSKTCCKHTPVLLLLIMFFCLAGLTACSSEPAVPKAGEQSDVEPVAGADGTAGEELGAAALETAVSQAILEEHMGVKSEGNFACESHVILATEDGPTAANNQPTTVTVYALVLYEEYLVSQEGISTVSGSHIPTALTFAVEADDQYILQEYWIPGDGSNYASDIEEKFPEQIQEEAIDTQAYILMQTQNCYDQAVQYGQVDTDRVIAELLADIMSSPAESANPADYIAAHPVEYREMTYYGDYTLRYLISEYLKGGQTGLQGQVMRSVLVDLIGDEAIAMDDSNGQEYFDAWQQQVQKTAEEKGEAYVKENMPCGFILLQM